ncbi:MAG: hypothetical protein R2939_03975 [Kofleriaceae bacterium]
MLGRTILAGIALAGCLAGEGAAIICADGTVCPEGRVCAPAGGTCVDPSQVQACVGPGEGDPCELVGVGAGVCRAGLCVVGGCGDGIVDAGEACDDGNQIDADGCTNACALPSCGDGVRQDDEACDDGAANGDDRACTSRCLLATCGDGFVHAGVEACDAGAGNDDASSCTTTCAQARCGDGLVWAGVEACDDGNAASGDGCRADCRKVEACGDGVVDVGEACDDANANPADGCDACAVTTWSAEVVIGGDLAATDRSFRNPIPLAVDRAGNVFVAETYGHRVTRIDAVTGAATTVAGSGLSGYGGDGGPATAAGFQGLQGIAVDGAGNLYLGDSGSERVRKVDAASGTISTIAGNGSVNGVVCGGQPATESPLYFPGGVAVDGLGNVFLLSRNHYRICRVDAETGAITRIVGAGSGYAGDGGPAVAARFSQSYGIAVAADGTLYLADAQNYRIRKVDPQTGIISTFAGTGTNGYAGDGGPATAAEIGRAWGVAVDGDGDVYFADGTNHVVRRVDLATGTITTVAGTGEDGFAGDGGPATAARLRQPSSVGLDGAGNLFILDYADGRVRRVDAATGIITTIGGDGAWGASGDGGFATSAPATWSAGVVPRPDGIYIAETAAHRIRRVDRATGLIETVAGTGNQGFEGDGGPAREARLSMPYALAFDAAGRMYISDTGNHRVRRVDADGTIATIAGTGAAGFGGDGGVASAAALDEPHGLAFDGAGTLFVADHGNHRVRRIDATTGVITTHVGTGVLGSSGDGGPATSARLAGPWGLAVNAAGDLWISEYLGYRVRRVRAATGTIELVAGGGATGNTGDGGPATSAWLYRPSGLAVDADDNLYIAAYFNDRLRRVDAATGTITTVLGGSAYGSAGDGGPVSAATLYKPYDVALDADGALYVADGNGNIRRIDPATAQIITVAGSRYPLGMGPVAQARWFAPEQLAFGPELVLVAGGVSGTVQALRTDVGVVEVVAGRYTHEAATGAIARLRASDFGAVGGVAWDATAGVLYLTETSHHRLHVVTPVDPGDADTWTIAVLANVDGTQGHADGAAATARFSSPSGLYFDDASRQLYVADADNHVVRAIDVDAGTVSTVAGVPATRGFFGDGGAATDALLFAPRAVTRCPGGDLFVADNGNHRVRRIEAGSGVITTVLGDGVAASSGEGAPAYTFPVDAPAGLACDRFGNLLVTSTDRVRLLPARVDLGAVQGVVDGTGAVQTIYAPSQGFPATATSCLSGLAVVDDATTWVTDTCTGLLVELWRQPELSSS